MEDQGESTEAQIFGRFLDRCMALGELSDRILADRLRGVMGSDAPSFVTVNKHRRGLKLPEPRELSGYAKIWGLSDAEFGARWRRGEIAAEEPLSRIEDVRILLTRLTRPDRIQHLDNILSGLDDRTLLTLRDVLDKRIALMGRKKRVRLGLNIDGD